MKDELFLRGAQVPMTKEAVRALALAKLELHRARHLIDIGAGTGSVSIEA
ncbi:TPA: cobalt-precorrin-6Y C(15)-methyltransferase, partial [Klebsiella pneumoniae]|nr:cobalt-precorrin-6Y C(15)-methyltransferase [Klebsiella pneumoniae]